MALSCQDRGHDARPKKGDLSERGRERIGLKVPLAAITPVHGANSRIENTTALVVRLSVQPEPWCEVAISSRMTRCGVPTSCEPGTPCSLSCRG